MVTRSRTIRILFVAFHCVVSAYYFSLHARAQPAPLLSISQAQKQKLQAFIKKCVNDLYNLRVEEYRGCIAQTDQTKSLSLYKHMLQDNKSQAKLQALANKTAEQAFNEMTLQVVRPMVQALRRGKKTLNMYTNVLATRRVTHNVHLALVEVAILSDQNNEKIDLHQQPFYFSIDNDKFYLRTDHDLDHSHR